MVHHKAVIIIGDKGLILKQNFKAEGSSAKKLNKKPSTEHYDKSSKICAIYSILCEVALFVCVHVYPD